MRKRLLIEVIRILYDNFPFLRSASVYGSALSALEWRPRELSELRRRGLTRIHMGFESGSDVVLEILNKGIGSEGLVDAASRIKTAGIELFLYVLIGAGGRDLRAALVNEVAPDALEVQTLVPVPGTPLFEEARNGRFSPLSPHDSISEIIALIERLEVPLGINCSHLSNHCQVSGRLPEDRERLLRELEYSLSIDESLFDSSGIVNIVPSG